MKLRPILFFLLLFLSMNCYSQVYYPIPIIEVPEHGFLPGKKFPYYSTIEKFDFNGLKLNVEIFDNREILKLKKIDCSDIDIENNSEFASPLMIYKIGEYISKIFFESGILIDTLANETVIVKLEAIDSRLIGFGQIRVHGLCQLRIFYKDREFMYCTDIKDGDDNSPLGRNSFATRQTASRYLTSASIRECLEKFLKELKEL